jgi:MFS family permease
MHRHLEHLDKNKLRIVNFISFFIGFSQALVIYVISSYFVRLSGQEDISIYYLLAYLIVLWALLNLHKYVHQLGKVRVFIFSSLFKIVFNILIIAMPFSWWTIVFLIMYIIAMGVEWVNMDSLLETFSTDKVSGTVRGLHLTLVNLGFLFGPFLSMTLWEKFDFEGIFLVALILNIFIFLFSLIYLRDIQAGFNKQVRSLEVIILAVKNKDVFLIYYISFVLEFFYALMIIYTPIYLHKVLDFSVLETGNIFTIMLIPFVLLQYPAGVLADKKMGEKKLLIVAIIIMALATLVCFFFAPKILIFWGIVLFFTRIGAALIEILRDSYFYKLIDGRDVDFINFFRSAMPLAYVAAAGVSAILLLYFPIKSVFLIVFLVTLSALIPAFKLKDGTK